MDHTPRRPATVVLATVLLALPWCAWAGETLAGRRTEPRVATPVWTQLGKLAGVVDPQGDANERFAQAVALDGDTAVVGVPGKYAPHSSSGTVFVFVRTGDAWTRQATLLPPVPADGLEFGASVAINGDTVAVGVGGYVASPRVYVYRRSGSSWTLEGSLGAPEAEWTDSFGASVAVSGDTVVVSAPEANTPFGGYSGAAYVFVRTGSAWSQQHKLLSTDLAADDRFGESVAIDGDTALVGASGDDTGVAINAGSAYVFTRTGSVWTQRRKLLPSAAASGDSFGMVVALAGSTAVVTAPGAAVGNVYGAGTAFVFEGTGDVWAQTASLVAPTPGNYGGFGRTMALAPGVVALGGAYSPDPLAVHVFRGGGTSWALEAALSPSVQGTGDGSSLAASGSSIVVGAPFFEAAGAAFVYTFTTGAWAEQARLDNTGSNRRDAFGTTVVVDGDTMAVGSPTDDTLSGRGSGSVTLFTRTAGVWTVRQKLAPGAGEAQRFGRSLALDGALLVVGAATYDYFDDGCAYVYRNTGSWSLEQRLVPSPGRSGGFGTAVALRGGTLMVGEPSVRDAAGGTGEVSVFTRPGTEWVVQQVLRPARPTEPYQSFGAGLALADGVALVGAPGNYRPRVEVFRRVGTDWVASQEIPGPTFGESFGAAIALDGVDAVIGGAPGPSSYAFGSAYVFRDSGSAYSLVRRFDCPSTYRPNRCGQSVDLSGDRLLVGEPWDSSAAGSVLVFARTGNDWGLEQKLVPSDGPRPGFGSGAALAGSQVAVGAPDLAAYGAGAVYLYARSTSNLSLAMAASAPSLAQGALLTLTLTVGNQGSTPVAGAAVVLRLAPGFVYHGVTCGTCSNAPGDATCTFDTIGPGATGVVELRVAAAAVGSHTLFAAIPNGASAQVGASVLPASADLAVSMSGPGIAGRGEILTYWIEVENQGPGAAAAVSVSLPTPPGLLLQSVGEHCVALPCFLPTLSAGASAWIEVGFEVPLAYYGPNPIVATVAATAANADPVPGNNVATARTALGPNATRLRLYTLPPCRLVDTRRAGLGGPSPLSSGAVRYAAAAGPCGIPSTARALAVNVTATEPTHAGHLRVYPAASGVPEASFVKYAAGSTRANSGVVGLGPSSEFVVAVGQAAGTVHVIVDVVGYFR